ncbi:MAG: hypothetical protein NXI18_21250 [Alphaproteobacteria bacterium]|nr:hypothetical protein [Alphaproteobacteria bacterium]
MGLGGSIIGDAAARRVIAWTLLVLVMLRAAIPVGFMPDLDALRDGWIEIVICTPGGLKTIAVSDAKGGPAGSEDGSSTGPSAHECPFDAVVSQAALLADPVLDIGYAVALAAKPVTAGTAAPTLQSFGPPLGSRAPPA